MNKESGSQWKLGMFVVLGVLLFVVTIYFVGKQQNLFGSTFNLKSNFKSVSGLQVGNNVRFAGINIGTVSEIEIKSDSNVVVVFSIKEEVRQFIKTDATASIGSDGLMGDKVLTVAPGVASTVVVKDNAVIASKAPVDMEDVMASVKTSVDNAGIITAQLAQFTTNMNDGNGTLSKLMTDQTMGNSIKSSILNLQSTSGEFSKFAYKMNNGKGAMSKLITDERVGRMIDSTVNNIQVTSKGFTEITEAAKHNFLLRGFFKKKEKAEAKKQEDIDNADEEEMKREMRKALDSADAAKK